jgi:hypothetical protein
MMNRLWIRKKERKKRKTEGSGFLFFSFFFKQNEEGLKVL